MMTNNKIIDKLVSNQDKSKELLPEEVPTWREDEVMITVSRVVDIRYKIYIVVLIFAIFTLGYNYVLPSFDLYESKKASLSSVELQMTNFENKQKLYELNKDLVDKSEQLENQIVWCVNDLKWCQELPEMVKNNFGSLRSYILTNEMWNEKMEVNEKLILENIDSFLSKKVLNQGTKIANGNINKIYIWDKQQYKDKLYFVPIKLNISFKDKESLLSFIDNTEKKIPENDDIRMLYKIDQISYNVVDYDVLQDTDISMFLYFYQA